MPAGDNCAGASSPTGLGRHRCGTEVLNGGLAFFVFDREIKFLGSRFASPGEVLLGSGEVLSVGGHTGFAERNGEQASAGGRLSSHAAAGHPWWPSFPFSACLVAAGHERGPIPATLLECMRGDAHSVWINQQAAKIFKNLSSLAKPLWISETGWRITRSCCPSSCLVLPTGARNTSRPALLTGISAVSLPRPAQGKMPVSSKNKK